MPQQGSVDKFFGAVDDAYDVLLDTLKASVDRGHRVSKGLIEQVETGQQDALKFAHTVATAPSNIGKVSGAVVENFTKTQGRVLDASRQWLDEAVDTQRESREALRRLIEANRHAGEAVIESSRGLFGVARDRARQAVRLGRDGSSSSTRTQSQTRSRRKAQTEETKTE